MSVKIPVQVLDPRAAPPVRARTDDAGLDLRCIEAVTIPAGSVRVLRTGLAIALPSGYCGQLWGRSGLGLEGLAVRGFGLGGESGPFAPLRLAGLIDPSYRGELKVVLAAVGPSGFTFEPGDRVAQLVIVPYLVAVPLLVAELEPTGRGAAGFGSSGYR